MPVIEIITIVFAAITIYLCYDEYKKGKMSLRNFKIVSICESLRFLYKGIIIKHNKTEPTYTKTSLFLCEKRRFFMARTEKGVVATI